MDNLNKVRVPDIQFNNLGGFDHGLPTYVFPNQTKLHTGNMRPAKSPPPPPPPPPPSPPPHTTNFWTQLKEWLSKPLNLSLVLCIIALLIVILF